MHQKKVSFLVDVFSVNSQSFSNEHRTRIAFNIHCFLLFCDKIRHIRHDWSFFVVTWKPFVFVRHPCGNIQRLAYNCFQCCSAVALFSFLFQLVITAMIVYSFSFHSFRDLMSGLMKNEFLNSDTYISLFTVQEYVTNNWRWYVLHSHWNNCMCVYLCE